MTVKRSINYLPDKIGWKQVQALLLLNSFSLETMRGTTGARNSSLQAAVTSVARDRKEALSIKRIRGMTHSTGIATDETVGTGSGLS
jgi:hypothetical protein